MKCGCNIITPEYSDPEIYYCNLHAAAPALLQACKASCKYFGRLHDMISDLIETKKITQAQLPDDYLAIVATLERCNEVNQDAEKAIKKTVTLKATQPTWFA